MKKLLPLLLLFAFIFGCTSQTLPANPNTQATTQALVADGIALSEGIKEIEGTETDKPKLIKLDIIAENQVTRAKLVRESVAQKDTLIKKQDEKIDGLEEAVNNSSTKYLGMLIAFGAVVMVLGVVGFFYNFRVGLTMLAIGGITVGVSAATMIYLGLFALISLITFGVGMLALIGYLAWTLFDGRKAKIELQEKKKELEHKSENLVVTRGEI